MAQAFDEWERRYKADPDGFGNDMQAARDHTLKSPERGVSLYGHTCAAFLQCLMAGGRKAKW
jgi:hypothetical protein